MVSWSPRLMQSFNYQNVWCQNHFHTNRPFAYQVPSDNFFQQPMVSWQEASEPNLTIELLKRFVQADPNSPNIMKDIASATLKDVSNALPSHELQLRPPVSLPPHELRPTPCIYMAHLPEVTLLLSITQSMGTAPSTHSRLV